MTEGGLAGADTGGTFTDFVFRDAAGRIAVRKRLSTPDAPDESVLNGLREGLEAGEIAAPFLLTHGTTAATNALLQRKGTPAALLMTAGFRDVLAIGRQNRSELYALHPSRPAPILAREHCFEITERVDWQGEIVTPLDEIRAAALLDELKAQGIESLAVCFLFSYLNPAHEQRIGEMARERQLNVSLSCEIAPEPREFERASTAAANAFVAPILARYLDALETQAKAIGVSRLRVMQSNGGTLSAAEASRQAIRTALSGPAGGAAAAAALGKRCGLPRLITFDMGGTSTDVALIENGECPVTTMGELDGIPLRIPMLAIHTIGAGGGSLARLDAGGGLRVGPESAGAIPGPVACGRGEILTVTDANVFLGRLPDAARLGGAMALDRKRVSRYFAEFAARMSIPPETLAAGILDVANAAMSRALRHVSVERGHDPADFTLISFGGAGGLHACALADLLDMKAIVVPCYPGAFSALGLAFAPVRREYVRSFPAALLTPENASHLTALLEKAERDFLVQAQNEMEAEGLAAGEWTALLSLDLRYAGQSFALRTAFDIHDGWNAALSAFHRAHRERYGYASPHEPAEAIAARMSVEGRAEPLFAETPAPAFPAKPFAFPRVYFGGAWQETALYRREEIAMGQRIAGPAILLQPDATTLLPPAWQAVCDKETHLHLTVSRPQGE